MTQSRAPTTGLPAEPFALATSQVNELRGRCLDAFTRAEAAATEYLAAIAGTADRGGAIRLPHLVGQRLEALAAAIADGGPFAAEGRIAADALDRVRPHQAFRNMLCHGTGKVSLDLQGRWTVVFRLVTLRSRRVARETLALDHDEAQALRDDVVARSRELCSQLGQVRAAMRL